MDNAIYYLNLYPMDSTQMVSQKQSHPVDTDPEGTIESVRINRVGFKGAVSRNSDKLGNYKVSVMLRET